MFIGASNENKVGFKKNNPILQGFCRKEEVLERTKDQDKWIPDRIPDKENKMTMLAIVATSDHRLHCLEAPLANINPNMERIIAKAKGMDAHIGIEPLPPRNRKIIAKTETSTRSHEKEGKRMLRLLDVSFLLSSIREYYPFSFILAKNRLTT